MINSLLVFFSKASLEIVISISALLAIIMHVFIKNVSDLGQLLSLYPLYFAYLIGGLPLVYDLFIKLKDKQYGSDLLAGLSIIVSFVLEEYLAGVIVILMLSGGKVLEDLAIQKASSVLNLLAKRMPSTAHRYKNSNLEDILIESIMVGDHIEILPHETCPVDGEVLVGNGEMDESYLTGEPFAISKVPGSIVMSGAINGSSSIRIKATKLPIDSRFAKIVKVLKLSEQNRPHIRRLADKLGAWYTPIALIVAGSAWLLSNDPIRGLAVLVVATPCPLLIAIPVTIIGAVSLAAKRGIIIKNPAALEQVEECQTIILDKTGTLTTGKPELTGVRCASNFSEGEVIQLSASLERYSKHPLAAAILEESRKRSLNFLDVSHISEPPGEGLKGMVGDRECRITSRKLLKSSDPTLVAKLPESEVGLECIILVDNKYAAQLIFRDKPRLESTFFVKHLATKHNFSKVMIVSGDRESEVKYLAEQIGISEIHGDKSPEDKVAIVTEEVRKAKTLFIGDGINDAPALVLATVGIAFGQNSDVTSEASDAVILDSSISKIDEFFHISRRMRSIALQSALGGMSLSIIGMGFAAFGMLTPLVGALLQEVIDLLSVVNALRASVRPKILVDY